MRKSHILSDKLAKLIKYREMKRHLYKVADLAKCVLFLYTKLSSSTINITKLAFCFKNLIIAKPERANIAYTKTNVLVLLLKVRNLYLLQMENNYAHLT